MSDKRPRLAAKRALAAAERTPSPFRATSRARRRARRRIGSLDDSADATAAISPPAVAADTAAAAAAGGEREPESEERTNTRQQQRSSDSASAWSSRSSSKASTPTRLAGGRSPDVDTFSVISGDASPHGSVFDFLSFGHADSAVPFTLLTPSPGVASAGAASSPLSRRSASALSSPSRFFRSPFNAAAATKKQTRSSRARRLEDSADSEEQLEVRASVDSSGDVSGATLDSEDVRIKEEIVVEDGDSSAPRTPTRRAQTMKEEIPQLMDMMSLSGSETLFSPWPRASLFAATPSPPSRVQFLSRRLREDFDREHGDDDVSDSDSSIGTDELYRSAPSGLASGEQDSFFSFAHSLSPLVHAEEFETSFMSARLSPLVSLDSYELPRLIPPFPMPKLDDDADADAIARETATPGRAAATPKTPLYRRATFSGYSSGSSRSSASSTLNDSFPNIQASTSATPGQFERSKIGTHSIMKMKLHVSTEQSTLSHSKRDIEAINNSLRKKGRKRKLDEKRGLFADVAPVQRKLLQTPLKASPSRSPPHPWSGRAGHQEVSFRLDSTPRRPGSGGAYSVLSTSTPSSASSASRQMNGASTPVSSALVMTPSSSWKKSRSMPPSGLTPGGFGGGLSTPQSSRLRRTPLRYAASVTSVLSVIPGTPTGPIKQRVGEPPPKTPTPPVQAVHAVPVPAVPPADDTGMSTPAPASRASDSSSAAVSAKPAAPKKAPCNCKKSKCLKLYCECFASGGYCDESCNCQGCSNTPATEAVRQQAIAARLEKNPNAFKPKIEATAALTPAGLRGVRGTPGSGAHSFLTPVGHGGRTGAGARASAGDMKKMHKHGCHCKKSACQKKYCECFQAGVPCGDNCRCIDCKNQAPCASHASGGPLSANATPSRLLNDVDDAFVSPVLHNGRHRMRIEREAWAKTFSSPLELTPRRTDRFRSHLRASTTMLSVSARGTPGGAGVGHRAKTPSTPSLVFLTPTANGAKRQKLSVSPVAEGAPAAAKPSAKTQPLFMATPGGKHVVTQQCADRLSASTVSREASSGGRVLLYPLFGDELPPVKSAVSAAIFHCLTNADLYNASLVSKLWNQVALGDSVWDHANFVRASECDGSDESAAEIVDTQV